MSDERVEDTRSAFLAALAELQQLLGHTVRVALADQRSLVVAALYGGLGGDAADWLGTDRDPDAAHFVVGFRLVGVTGAFVVSPERFLDASWVVDGDERLFVIRLVDGLSISVKDLGDG
jgi:hypothetical protein